MMFLMPKPDDHDQEDEQGLRLSALLPQVRSLFLFLKFEIGKLSDEGD